MNKLNKKNKGTFITLLSAISLMLFFTVFSSQSYAHNTFIPSIASDTTKQEYLELKGNVRQSKSVNEKEKIKPIDSAEIAIYSNDTLFSEVYTNKKGRCIFKLPLDTTFKIKVSKPGFTTKYFEVNSSVPLDKKNTFSFSFDIDLFEVVKGLDISILQKPIAKVTYNPIVEQFAYDIKYTSRINMDLKKMYKNYYLIQKVGMDTLKIQPLTQQKKQ